MKYIIKVEVDFYAHFWSRLYKKFTKEKCPTKMPKPTYFSFLKDIAKII